MSGVTRTAYAYPGPMPRRPSARYLALMNGPYDRVLAAGVAPLNLTYDGAGWTARIAVRPAGRGRWVSGEGATLEAALVALAGVLGVVLGE